MDDCDGLMSVAKAIEAAFITPNEVDRNFENPGVTDGLFYIARQLGRIADAIEAHGSRTEETDGE